jgi:hypothetical protein
MIQQAIGENAHFALDQGEFQERYNGLVDRIFSFPKDINVTDCKGFSPSGTKG